MTDNAVVTSAYFYTSREQPDSTSLIYCSAGANDVQTSSVARASTHAVQSIATAPQFDTGSLLEVPEMPRPRSNSAPMILYQQVALQLRGISDDFNREFMHDTDNPEFRRNTDEAPATLPRVQQHGRRLSLPDVHRHEPRSQNWLHLMIQSFRRTSNATSRSHNSSISRVPEENAMDTEEEEDELDRET